MTRGSRCSGLGADDFVVEADGVDVEITGVSFYTSRYDPDHVAGTSLDDGLVPTSRFFVLFFHDPLTTGSIGGYWVRQREKARRGALTWAEEHLAPSDWVAVVAHDTRLKIYLDFSQDREAIRQAIDHAARRRHPERDADDRPGRRRLPLPGTPSLRRSLPNDLELGRRTRSLEQALGRVADAAGSIVGRKNLVLFSAGFGELDPNGLVSEPDRRYYRDTVETLNDRNVAVYPIDLTPMSIRNPASHALQRLALSTGGRSFRDPIRFATPLREIAAETTGYYLISFQSGHPAGESGYRRVEVEARDPKIRLRARTGYHFGVD
ncbi:MAG: VWA domain-containing protein [Acidobacteriota bacterium]